MNLSGPILLLPRFANVTFADATSAPGGASVG